jgi:tRNA pseudouridine38-40 synthase
VKLKGASRTDSGVHSRHQVANFKTNSKLALKSVKDALNSSLPQDILITAAEEVFSKFDSQRSARLKHYRYTVTTERFVDPFIRHFAAKFPYPLNLNSIRSSANALVGKHNFKAFQASGLIYGLTDFYIIWSGL